MVAVWLRIVTLTPPDDRRRRALGGAAAAEFPPLCWVPRAPPPQGALPVYVPRHLTSHPPSTTAPRPARRRRALITALALATTVTAPAAFATAGPSDGD